MENTETTRFKLAVKVVEGWDLDALMEFAIDTLEQTYRMAPVVFDDDWEETFGEEVEEVLDK